LLINTPSLSFAWNYAEKGGVLSNNKILYKPIPKSDDDELTLVSFNVRNLGARSRSIKDYAILVDLIDETDIVFLQEVENIV
jgi:hypothetical protein